MALTREQIAQRVAQELQDGYYVNLGIGIPTLVANYVPDGMEVMLQSENGLLGMGQFPTEEEIDADLINAGKQTVTMAKGASIFDSAESFAMIRGGHIDITVLGVLEVSEKGDLANWMFPGRGVGNIGGGMDLAFNARKVIAATEHTTKDGKPKIVSKCSVPLTAPECVDVIITDVAVIGVTGNGLMLKEVAPGWTAEEVQALTEPRLVIDPDLTEIEL